ncbi:MAG: C45 family autoproteolytic acyltransferase/hydrolase [Chloroflexota bacterium]
MARSVLKSPAAIVQHDGVLVLELTGTPYERGQQHGTALAEQVRHLRGRLINDIVFGKGTAMGAGFLGILYGILARMHPNIPRELREEMRGVAAGARVAYRDILLLNCFDDVLHALIQLNPVLAPLLQHRFVKPVLGLLGAVPPPAPVSSAPGLSPGFACSSFVLTGESSTLGTPIHGRNLDYMVHDDFIDPEGIVPRELRANVVVFVVRPSQGRAFASIAWPGFVGLVTALNADGLSLACLTSTVPRETANGTPLLMLYRLAAQYAGSLDEAEWLLRGTRRTIGNNLTAASAVANEGRLFEFTMERLRVTPEVDGLVVATNHFQHPAMSELQGGWVVPSSAHRLARLREVFNSGRHGIEEAQAALSDRCPPAGAIEVWDCLANPGTIYSSITDPAGLRLWVRAYDRADRDWVQLDLAERLRAA